MKNFKMLWFFLKGNRLTYIAALISICLASLLSTIIPIIMKTTIDSIIGDNPFDLPAWGIYVVEALGGREYLSKNLWICGLILVIVTGTHGLLLFCRGWLGASASENSGKRLKEKMYNHIVHLPYDFHVKSHTGDLIQRCTSDVETIQNFIANQFLDVGKSIFSFSLIITLMLSINWNYALSSIVILPFILVSTTVFFTQMKKVFKLSDESEGRLTSALQENITGVRVVKAFGARNFEIRKFDEKNVEYRDHVKKIINLTSLFVAIADFLCLSQYGFVLAIGILRNYQGTITLGTFVAFLSYAGMLIWPIRELGHIFAFMGQAFVSLNRVQEILDQPVESSTPEDVRPDINGEIVFDNVTFGYEEGKPILKDLSFKIRKGQTVAILGSTGSGKSSLTHLLIRLYGYQKGSIKLDGVELRCIDRKWLRRHIGIVLQEPFLFSKTIKENIRYGNTDAHDAEIHASSSIAAIHETIMSFEKGYDTVVGEMGVTLSGGQRQRLAISRTVIRNVPILIFDDSLSAVDMETDARIRSALKKRRQNTTTIIVSHRITTLAEADLILVIEDGRVNGSGRHEDLIQQNGLYRKVWELQNSLGEGLDDAI